MKRGRNEQSKSSNFTRDISGNDSSTVRAGQSTVALEKADLHKLDLDDLFSGITAKKAVKASETLTKESKAREEKEREKSEAASLKARLEALEKVGRAANGIRGDESPKPLRFDPQLGVKIFSVDSLKIGKGKGDTSNCPFDCFCCY